MAFRGFLHNLWDLINSYWYMIDREVRNNVHAAVITVQHIKEFVANPEGDFTSVIDPEFSDELRSKLMGDLPDIEQMVRHTLVGVESETVKEIAYHMLAVMIAKYLCGNDFTLSEVIQAVDFYYNKHVKK